MSETTLALLVTLGLAILIPAVLLALATHLGPTHPTPTKSAPYESGIQRMVGTARERFSVKFYLVAILFILFDVEIVFLFPWAVNLRTLGMIGFFEMFLFIGILLVGYIYILRRGALKWD
ncbi:MAG: NADH-quinone oxidoreductase subunit A [Cyanobacteria bacterium NC_groundwater_1444_Ag_S-0.65um_54_12]|nr:NADH-quinone oxidoreductase subunit A [Cyanobacteria bacterium NC_groundwater_1444_Ag_S-0.65um_54_12]